MTIPERKTQQKDNITLKNQDLNLEKSDSSPAENIDQKIENNPESSQVNRAIINEESSNSIDTVNNSNSNISLPPISPEFMPENLLLQQQRTEIVADVISAAMHAEKTNLRDFGNLSASWNNNNGELTLTDTETGKTKMVAEWKENKWVSKSLPYGSPGLSSDETNYFQDLAPQIKTQILSQYKQQLEQQQQEQQPRKMQAATRSGIGEL